jgi:hypothetical protein
MSEAILPTVRITVHRMHGGEQIRRVQLLNDEGHTLADLAASGLSVHYEAGEITQVELRLRPRSVEIVEAEA